MYVVVVYCATAAQWLFLLNPYTIILLFPVLGWAGLGWCASAAGVRCTTAGLAARQPETGPEGSQPPSLPIDDTSATHPDAHAATLAAAVLLG